MWSTRRVGSFVRDSWTAAVGWSRRSSVALTLSAAFVVVLMLVSGCALNYSGQARPIAASQVTASDGWLLVSVPTVHQRSESDCGAAALAMVVARWRPALTRDVIARSLTASPQGFRLGDMRDLARASGLVAFAVQGDRALLTHELEVGRPLVIGLHRPYGKKHILAHYEVVVAIAPDGRVVTIDPSKAGEAWQVRPWVDFLAEWQAAGLPALVVIGAT